MRWFAFGGGALSVIVLAACGSFGAGTNSSSSDAAGGTSSSSSSGSPSAEGGGGGETISDGGKGDGGLPPMECFDLGKNPGAFETRGTNVNTNAGGYLFRVDGTARGIQRSFTLTKEPKITLSSFKIDRTVTNTGLTNFGGYLDLLGLYYGDPPVLFETAAQNVTILKDGFEVNAWWAPGTQNYDGPAKKVGPFPLGGGAGKELFVTTKWAVDGFTELRSDGVAQTVKVKTSTINANKVTLFIGGQTFNGAPAHNVVVRSVCVSQS
jgi:hypothetical protein